LYSLKEVAQKILKGECEWENIKLNVIFIFTNFKTNSEIFSQVFITTISSYLQIVVDIKYA
jgi:hypothetical protein